MSSLASLQILCAKRAARAGRTASRHWSFEPLEARTLLNGTAIEVDIKPEGEPNSINLGSNGVLPVAILTTAVADGDDVDFDAADLDPSTIEFGDVREGYARVNPVKWNFEDVDGDGDIDLIVHFSTPEIRAAVALDYDSVEAELTALNLTGEELVGTDSVRMVPPSHAAVFRDGVWFLDGDGKGQFGERMIIFGIPGDVPLTGDWNGDGFEDLAVWRRGMWYLDLDGNGGLAEHAVLFGHHDDVPFVGDWDGDGDTDIGVFRHGVWFLDYDGDGLVADQAILFGLPGDTPVVGDWDGDGDTDFGVYRGNRWHFDLDDNGGIAEKSFKLGIRGDVAVVGDWDNDGITDVGVFRKGEWYFDTDAEGELAEKMVEYGLRDDRPVSGRWLFEEYLLANSGSAADDALLSVLEEDLEATF